MRVFTLKCVSYDGMKHDPHEGRTVDDVEIVTEECVTVSDMVSQFNRLLAVMGFVAKVDVTEDDE